MSSVLGIYLIPAVSLRSRASIIEQGKGLLKSLQKKKKKNHSCLIEWLSTLDILFKKYMEISFYADSIAVDNNLCKKLNHSSNF